MKRCLKGLAFPLSLALLSLVCTSAIAQSSTLAAPSTKLICGQLTIPWEMDWMGKDEIIFSELSGQIRKVNIQTQQVKTLYKVPGLACELQAGLMGLALHPDFPKNTSVFIAYTYYEAERLFLKVDRLTYQSTMDNLQFDQTIVEKLAASSTNIGGRLLCSPSGYLFLSVGDRKFGDSAQDTLSPNGKILRYRLDGSIPADNPIPGNPLWAYGFRNPQGLTLMNGRLYGSDHGTFNNDELNRITKGANYGWPLLSGPCEGEFQALCTFKNLSAPLQSWTPTIAPSGMAHYAKAGTFPSWENSLLMASLKGQKLKVLRLSKNGNDILEEKDFLSDMHNRIRDVLVSPEGRVFICTSNSDMYGGQADGSDKILELVAESGDTDLADEDATTIPPTDEIRLDSTVLEIRVLAKNLRLPWDMVWGPDNHLWFSERGGAIRKMDPESGRMRLVYQAEDVFESKDNSGMHAFALHPDFPNTPYGYVHYTNENYNSKLVRLRYDLQQETFQEDSTILPIILGHVTHNGSRLQFAKDGSLFFCVGDAYKGRHAQKIKKLNGKILRIWPDGRIPADNPFENNPVWSYGHRNPQGMVLTEDGRLYASEHGASNDDELNLITKGRNYGWPEVEGWCDLPSEKYFCSEHNIAQPLITWTPTQAPAGLDYYDHPAIPEWRNSLLQVFLKGESLLGARLKQVKLNEAGDRIAYYKDFLNGTFGRLRDVLVAPDGRVFLCTSNRETNGNGSVLRTAEDDRIIELRAASPLPSNKIISTKINKP
ncbi:MAG: PQQ-dependent sugar dehydrogenase [Bacteroidota bacterium]